MADLQGHFLLAAPALADPNFYRTVVLLLQHSEEGAFGLVLNRPSGRRLAEILEPITSELFDTEEQIYVGGPVAGPLLALHRREDLSELRVMDDLFAATSRDHLLELARQSPESVRFFSGYAGWGADQLEQEMHAGAWITTLASCEQVFRAGDADTMWNSIAKETVHSVLDPAIRIKHVPPDVSQN